MEQVALVFIDGTTRNFDKLYEYLIPNELKGTSLAGARVLVPFGSSDALKDGYILEVSNHQEYSKLKTIKEVKDYNILNQDQLSLIKWMKRRYMCTYFQATRCMIPAAARQSEKKQKKVRVAFLVDAPENVIDEIESGKINKIGYINILQILLENDFVSVNDLVSFSGSSRSMVNTLKKHGYIDFKDIEVVLEPTDEDFNEAGESMVNLTPLQTSVTNQVKTYIDSDLFREVLLHGVTGSGKTEVYLEIIEHCLKNQKTAIVLVPEISLTPQMVGIFKGRFGADVAILHSRMSLSERHEQWKLIKNEKVKIVVGARSAVFAPLNDIGIIIIDEEHEPTYKSGMTPKYDAREIAAKRCEIHSGVLLLGSATPSETTYYRAQARDIELCEMLQRINKLDMPETEIIDMRLELQEGNRSVFSRKLAEEIAKNLQNGQQTILFLNKRGYAPLVLCRKCGYTLKCPNCNIALKYHAEGNRLICHYCGYTIKNPTACPTCGSNAIKSFGAGTQKVEEEVKVLFPQATVLRMDADSTTHKNSHEDILTKFREENVDIMIGTQMIAKGHDFPNVTLVGILAADGLLNFGEYTSTERTFQLITQAAGRAGRGDIPGRVIVQSYNTSDYAITSACSHDYFSFYNQDILVREKLNYPPFTNIAIAVASSMTDKTAYAAAIFFKNAVKDSLNALEVTEEAILGPTRAPLTKINGKFRWRLVIKCRKIDKLIEAMTKAQGSFGSQKMAKYAELSVDVNPLDMV